ncbi:hypothetical protein [Helicobacter sp. 23-1045]
MARNRGFDFARFGDRFCENLIFASGFCDFCATDSAKNGVRFCEICVKNAESAFIFHRFCTFGNFSCESQNLARNRRI